MARTGTRTLALTVAVAFVCGGAIAAAALLVLPRMKQADFRPVWTELAWPFATDPWGKGKAFRCAAADCGTEIQVYLRAKVGFCNCVTGVADDAELDRMNDFDLVGGRPAPIAEGRPIVVGGLKGRSRHFKFADGTPRSVISASYGDRCDSVVATAVVNAAHPEKFDSAVHELLASPATVSWVERALGI